MKELLGWLRGVYQTCGVDRRQWSGFLIKQQVVWEVEGKRNGNRIYEKKDVGEMGSQSVGSWIVEYRKHALFPSPTSFAKDVA